eukprot:PhF_6_TR22574/c2_g2_i1/m.32150
MSVPRVGTHPAGVPPGNPSNNQFGDPTGESNGNLGAADLAVQAENVDNGGNADGVNVGSDDCEAVHRSPGTLPPLPPFSLLDFSTWVEGDAKVPRSDLVTLLHSRQEEYLELAKSRYGAEYDAKKEEEVLLDWKEIINQVEIQRVNPKRFHDRLQPDFTVFLKENSKNFL